jgi:hypothetical protein
MMRRGALFLGEEPVATRRTVAIEFEKDFVGKVSVRITATGIEVSAVDDVPVSGDGVPSWGADFLAMFDRFERYKKTSPCRALATALAQAGWTGTVPQAKGDKRSQSYIRWERARGPAAKPLVVYQHSKKLATLAGTTAEEAFYSDYSLDDGVAKTMAQLKDFVDKMTANSTS